MPKVSSRVAFFLRFLGGGGAERVILNLCRGFVARGLKVDLVLSAGGGPHLWQVPAEVRIIDLKAPRVSASLFDLVKYLQQEKPLAIVPALHYTGEVAILAKRISRVPTRVIVTEHNTLSREVLKERGSRKFLIPLAVKYLYPWVDNIVAVSRGVAQDLSSIAQLPLNRIQVIYNPVIVPGLLEKAKEPVDHPWFAPGEPPVVLGVGKLEAQKDFPNLIRAFAQVRQTKKARLVILGWGPDRPQLESLVRQLGLEEDVALPGHVDNPYAYMAKAGVFVLSSAWEGLPTVLIEAMAIGTPVVSTDCESGPAEILDNGKYGWLVPVGDRNALSTVILTVLKGSPKPVDAAWLNQFALETTTQQYLDLLGAS